jgi:hypothetical protein
MANASKVIFVAKAIFVIGGALALVLLTFGAYRHQMMLVYLGAATGWLTVFVLLVVRLLHVSNMVRADTTLARWLRHRRPEPDRPER